MNFDQVVCPECGRIAAYLFTLESRPGTPLCSECVRVHRHRQDGPPVAPRPRQERERRPRRRVGQEA